MGRCLPGWAVDRIELLVELSTCMHRSALQGGTKHEEQQTSAQEPVLSTLSFSKCKFKESEKSKFEPGLPGHYESIFVRAEGEKIMYLIVCLGNEL